LLSTNIKLRYTELQVYCIFYEYGTWSVTIWEKWTENYRKWASVEVTEGWRGVRDVHCLQSIIQIIKLRSLKLAGRVACIGENFIEDFGAKLGEEKMKFPEKSRRTWKYNIKTDVKRIRRGVNWVRLVQNRDQWRTLVNTVTKVRLP
jgi:hypothetical protein